jgi:predicted O-methyltransferase YrrM
LTIASETALQIDALLKSPPALHVDGGGRPVNYQIDSNLVPHLVREVHPGASTLETGAGISTIVFLALGAHHQAISPDPGEPERIRAYCADHGISTTHYVHHVASSESVLPTMTVERPIDVALVDGNHAFPVPCLDWYYATRLLKKGGVMIVDDIQLWSGKILADFLEAEDVWDNIARTPRFAIFRLRGEPNVVLGRWWGQQPYVVKHSQTLGSRPGLYQWFRQKLS